MASFLKRAQTYLGLGPDEEYEDYEGDDRVAPMEAVAPAEEPAPRPSRPAARSRPAPPPPSAGRAASPASKPPPSGRPAPPSAKPPPPSGRPAPPAAKPPPPSGRPAPPGAKPPPPSSRPAPPSGRPAPAPAPAGRGATRGRQTLPAPPAEPAAEAGSVRPLPGVNGEPAAAPRPKPVTRSMAASAKPVVVTPRHFNHAQEVADRFKAGQPVIMNLQGCDRPLARRLIDFASGLCYALDGNMEKVASQVYLVTPANVEVSAEERRRLAERGLHTA